MNAAASIRRTTTKGPLLCHTIVSREPNRQRFSKAGDFGAFVLLDRRREGGMATALGILVEGSRVLQMSYMVPMELVVRDVEAVTGMGVVKPVRVGIS